MTYLQLVNAVLRRLREQEVASLTSPSEYVQLIMDIVNEAKLDVEERWNWSQLRTSVDVTTTASDNSYNLTGTNERTTLLDAYNVSKEWPLGHVQNNTWINFNTNVSNVNASSPLYYDVVGIDTANNSEVQIRVWPTPSDVETLRFYCVIPQEDLSAASDILKVPAQPVIQGAYLRAINERGEDNGRLSEIQEALFTRVLSDAISRDALNYEEELVWRAI